MAMMNSLVVVFFVSMTALVALCYSAHVAEKPNIIVIMTNNQGYGDLGCYGGLRAETHESINWPLKVFTVLKELEKTGYINR
jgi:hypothetical protein